MADSQNVKAETAEEFAAVVASLERQLKRLPDERQIAEQFGWRQSQGALIALGQESRARGLVRIYYEADTGKRVYSADPSPDWRSGRRPG